MDSGASVFLGSVLGDENLSIIVNTSWDAATNDTSERSSDPLVRWARYGNNHLPVEHLSVEKFAFRQSSDTITMSWTDTLKTH